MSIRDTVISIYLVSLAIADDINVNLDVSYFDICITILKLIAIGLITLCVRVVSVRLNQSAAISKTAMHSSGSLNVSLLCGIVYVWWTRVITTLAIASTLWLDW